MTALHYSFDLPHFINSTERKTKTEHRKANYFFKLYSKANK